MAGSKSAGGGSNTSPAPAGGEGVDLSAAQLDTEGGTELAPRSRNVAAAGAAGVDLLAPNLHYGSLQFEGHGPVAASAQNAPVQAADAVHGESQPVAVSVQAVLDTVPVVPAAEAAGLVPGAAPIANGAANGTLPNVHLDAHLNGEAPSLPRPALVVQENAAPHHGRGDSEGEAGDHRGNSSNGGNSENNSGTNNVTPPAVEAAPAVAPAEPNVPAAPVNHAPLITLHGGGANTSVTVLENTSVVATVTATDADAGSTLTYSIIGGADASKFVIDANTGALSFVSAPDFENPTDAGGSNV
jgi:hypothetical protein